MPKSIQRVRLIAASLCLLFVVSLAVSLQGVAQAMDMTGMAMPADQTPYIDPQASTGNDVADKTRLNASINQQIKTYGREAVVAPDNAAAVKMLPATQGGVWKRLPDMPVATAKAYHVYPLPTGHQYLLMAGSGNDVEAFKAGTFQAFVGNFFTGKWRTIPVPTDMFCNGDAGMANGNALVMGGTQQYSSIGGVWLGSKGVYEFDVKTMQFVRRPDMNHGSWYPTVLHTANQYDYRIGGFDENGKNSGSVERYDERTGLASITIGSMTVPLPLYPHTMPWGSRVFYSGASYFSSTPHAPGFMNLNTGQFQAVGGLRYPTRHGSGASAFIGDYRYGNLVTAGGGTPASNAVDIINLRAAIPRYRPGPSLRSAKYYLSLVPLPTGQLVETNGGSANTIAKASHEVSMLTSVSAKSWYPLNPLPATGGTHRLYHSIALLDQGGYVLSFGSNPAGETRSRSVWAFVPPQLLRSGARPTITSAPAVAHYGQSVAMKFSGNVTRVSIMARPTPTHSMDVNMRQVMLPVTNGKVTLNFSANTLPEGVYWLWALDKNGKWSVAKPITLN